LRALEYDWFRHWDCEVIADPPEGRLVLGDPRPPSLSLILPVIFQPYPSLPRFSMTPDRPKLSEYRTVGEAAANLGVSTATLRNWNRTGKLTPRRHPQNGNRILLHEDLEAVLRSADLSTLSDEPVVTAIDWSGVSESEHFVQFYENDEYLVELVSEYVGSALQSDAAAVVIATEDHRRELAVKLHACGLDYGAAETAGRFVMLDAAETLATFMVDRMPDPIRFRESVGGVIRNVGLAGKRIRAFGEMVALLWAEGNRTAAIRLEELWNELGKSQAFALFCAYPIHGFDRAADGLSLEGVCACHSRVLPTESYPIQGSDDDRLRAITLLQQKARSLEAEIAHRQEVEKALAKRERELSDFFENAAEGLHKVGPDGTILWANKTECDLLGYSVEEYVGRPISDFHADRAVIERMLAKLACGETLKNFHARLRAKNGSIKHVLINSSACIEDGKFLYTRCFTRDVTRRWKAERELRDGDRRKDEFLATLAHELRNPLAPIKNALEFLKVGGNAPQCLEDVRGILDRQVRQMVRLVDDLLDVSRITRDKLELRKERVDLSSIIRSAVEACRPLIDSLGHQLIVRLPESPLWIEADATRMAQVFTNLLNNGAKYTDRGGHIEIAAELRATHVEVTVRDDGIGIACDELAYVFDMFRQVDHSLEKSQGGLGIGLTLVRRLVELHGGSVNARSDGRGKGSAFVVSLPQAAPESEASGARPCSAVATGQKRRILVVDDNHDSGDTLSMLLGLKGHQVRVARDGLESIDVASAFRPEVILMDVGMPKLNGYDATRRIRLLPWGKEVMIVALTGWGQEGDLHRSAEAGCTAHLVKPVDLEALEQLMQDHQPGAVDDQA
jgi:PAS domain S-box-containing protein